MTDDSSDSHGRPRRSPPGQGRAPWHGGRARKAGLLVAAVVSVALMAAGCSSNGSGTLGGSGSSSGGSPYQKALAFSQCVRSHGVPSFPDPNSQGNFVLNGINTNSTLFETAKADCKSLLPSGSGKPSGSLLQKAIGHLLKYSQCMRAHGLPNFPDPVSNSKGVSFPPMTGINPRSPQYQSAATACQSLLAGGVVAG
jgi:hypothetical protein